MALCASCHGADGAGGGFDLLAYLQSIQVKP